LTYYKRRSKEDLVPFVGGSTELTRNVGNEENFQREWVEACKGNKKTTCDFDYAGTEMEQQLLALVAYRAGKKLQYDPASGQVTNASEANQFLRRQYRQGWTLNG
jgi:hypothetical protein